MLRALPCACAQGGQNKMKLPAEIYKVSEGDL